MRDLIVAVGICCCAVIGGCTIVDGDAGESLAPGWGELELRGETHLVQADVRTLIPEAKALQVIRLILDDDTRLELTRQNIDAGLVRFGQSGDGETGAMFIEPRKLWTGDSGYMEIAKTSDGTLTGDFYIELFDSVSSCYRCEGTILVIEGRFHAIDR